MKFTLYLVFILFIFNHNINAQSTFLISEISQGLQVKSHKSIDTIFGDVSSYKVICDTLLYVVLNETYVTNKHHVALSICSYILTVGHLDKKKCTKFREIECLNIKADIQYDRIKLNYIKKNNTKSKTYTWSRLFKKKSRTIKTKCESIY